MSDLHDINLNDTNLSDKSARTLAIDYGIARVGVAVSDPLGMFATGLPTLPATPKKRLWHQLKAWVQAYNVTTVVIGLPLHMNGQAGEQAEISQAFADEWQTRYPDMPLVLWDERLTSMMAQQTLRELGMAHGRSRGKSAGHAKGDVDMLAAMRMLQEYLDANSRPSI
jgi:putative holliday junction resolvase